MSNRLSSRIPIRSSIKKTVKSKPLTRRAAAALFTVKSTQNGHVKKMANKIEQKIRSGKHFSFDLIGHFFACKPSANCCLNRPSKRPSSNARALCYCPNWLPSANLDSNPVLLLLPMPASLTQPKSVPANIAGKMMEKSEHRFSNKMLLNSRVLTQYRPVNLKSAVSTSTIKATSSKPEFGSVRNLTSQHLYTPSKLTRTEIDEKKKVDLMLKEQKEKERLARLDRLKQEKLNEAKRKRDETLKKVNEAKQKQKEDAEHKAKEMQLKEKQRKKLNNLSVAPKQLVINANPVFLFDLIIAEFESGFNKPILGFFGIKKIGLSSVKKIKF